MIGQRPDVKVRDADKKLAKSYDINLDEYIKPNKAIYGSFKFEGEFALPKKETAKSEAEELELVMSA